MRRSCHTSEHVRTKRWKKSSLDSRKLKWTTKRARFENRRKWYWTNFTDKSKKEISTIPFEYISNGWLTLWARNPFVFKLRQLTAMGLNSNANSDICVNDSVELFHFEQQKALLSDRIESFLRIFLWGIYSVHESFRNFHFAFHPSTLICSELSSLPYIVWINGLFQLKFVEFAVS